MKHEERLSGIRAPWSNKGADLNWGRPDCPPQLQAQDAAMPPMISISLIILGEDEERNQDAFGVSA